MKPRWKSFLLLPVLAITLLMLPGVCNGQRNVNGSGAQPSMVELISAEPYLVLQTLNDSGDVIVHLFGEDMKEAAKDEYKRLEKELQNEKDLANLDFGDESDRRRGKFWGTVTEAATQLTFHRGDLRLVKVTRRGTDFIGFEIPGQTETWLPLAKIAAVRKYED